MDSPYLYAFRLMKDLEVHGLQIDSVEFHQVLAPTPIGGDWHVRLLGERPENWDSEGLSRVNKFISERGHNPLWITFHWSA